MKMLVALASVRWRRPTPSQLKQEYEVEYKMKKLDRVYNDPFPTMLEFINAVNAAKVHVIDEHEDKRILNRSRCTTMEQLRSLVSTYRSWPEFRNDQTLQSIVDGFERNGTMDMPIVLEANGQRRILSGNTRMDIAFMHDEYPHVLIIKI